MGKIAAVVVTYNRKDLLMENIECLLAQKSKDLDIMIINNASTDGTEEALHDYITNQKIIYYNTGANLGGAGGFSFGIKKAAEENYEYVWVMDDDCMPQPDALNKLLSADEQLNGQYGFLSSKVLWKDGDICWMNRQRRTLTKTVQDYDNPLVKVVMASFVSLFLKTDIIKELGLPIKEFFIWTDDWEFTRRISRKYPCFLVNNSVVIHKSANNIGANIATDGEDRIDRYRFLYRNDVYLYRREGIKGFCYEAVRLTEHVLRVLLKAKDHKKERIQKIIQGTKEGLSFNPDIEYVRVEK